MTTHTVSDATDGFKSTGQERRVLIYRLGSLGDTLIALPALNLVARAFPNADRRMLTNFPINVKAPAAAAILDHTNLVHGFFHYSVGTRSPIELAKLWWTITSWRPDVLVYLAASRGIAAAQRDQRFFRLCGIKNIVGVPLTEEMQKSLPQPTYDSLEPEAERLVRNISSLGDGRLNDPANWDLHLTDAEMAKTDATIGDPVNMPLITVSVGTKMQSKDWGRDNWRALLSEMARTYPGHALALIGVSDEAETSEFAADGWRQSGGGPVVNLCGKLTPRESAAAFRRARIFVGHDSGPMHLAASMQTPCVAIFAARNIPRVWFPYGKRHRVLYHKTECYGCGLETCIIEKKRCITSITVEEVAAEVRAILG